MADKKSGTRKKTGISEFKKMVKALKLSKDEIADILGHTRLNPETGMREHRKGGGPVVKKKANGSLVGGQKKLDVNRDGKITGSDFEMLKMNKKKYGGKISYRMKGGQVVDAGYD